MGTTLEWVRNMGPDGVEYTLLAPAPDSHAFSQEHLDRLATDGIVSYIPGDTDVPYLVDVDPSDSVELVEDGVRGRNDLVILKTTDGELRYRVTARYGVDGLYVEREAD